MYALMEKTCSRCGVKKHTKEFNKDSKKPDGLRYECRKCQSIQTRIDSENRRIRLRESKFKAIHNGLSAIVKKVYEAVPIKDHWDKHKIILETQRLYPSLRDQNAILGCLDTLVRSGLVNELDGGSFRREHVEKPSVVKKQLEQEFGIPEKYMKQETTESVPHVSPIEKITRLQQTVLKIISDAKTLSDAIETVAIEVEMQFSERDAESKKLKQLQELLKGLV